MLSMTSDFVISTGCPEPYLRAIAEAGFTHVHWCHHWADDFLYSKCEIDQIARWLKEFGLGVCDLHASSGAEKNWMSEREYERLAGVELVANRIDMVADLGSDVTILHVPGEPAQPDQREGYWSRLRRSLEAVAPVARRRGVRIALENGDIETLAGIFAQYGPDLLGLCYDCGHGNNDKCLDRTFDLKDRLISVHLHDNDGAGDQHKIPFDGTVDWPKVARLVAESSYRKGVNCESVMAGYPQAEVGAWLREAYAACRRLEAMIDRCRSARPQP